MRVEKVDTGSPKYLITYPDDYKEGERRPIIFFLHGAGTRSDTFNLLESNAFFTKVVPFVKETFITVAPLCSRETWFDHFEELKELYRSVAESNYADPDRVYIVGNSMGGYGAWQLAISCPEYTAAILPICGGGMYWDAGRLVNVPVWAHHGADDTTVFPEESEKMVNAINLRGGNARLTVYPGVAHASWLNVYASEEPFEWLLSHKRQGAALENEYNDSARFG